MRSVPALRGAARSLGRVAGRAVWCVVLWQGLAAASPESAQQYALIQQAFLREDFQTVAALAQAFITGYPAAPEASRVSLWRALSLDRLGQVDTALQELARLEATLEPQQPLWAEVVFWEGDVSRRAAHLESAKAALTRLLDQAPASSWAPQGQVGLGLVYVQLHAYETGRRYFREVAQRLPDTALAMEARMYEGLCQLKLKRYAEAVEVLEPLAQRATEPRTLAQAAFYLGEGLTGLGRFREAARVYQQAIDVGDSSPWAAHARFALGWAQYGANRCEESVRTLGQYLAHDEAEHRAEALFARAICFMRLGQETQAQAQLEELRAHFPDHALAQEAALSFADSYAQRDQLDRAQALLQPLLSQSQDEALRIRVQLMLGAVALGQGDVASAQAAFAAAQQAKDPMLRQAALNGLGDLALSLGQMDEARRRFETSLELSTATPTGGLAAYQLGRLELQQGALEEAVQIFAGLSQRADQLLADDARLALAVALIQQGHREEAREHLERIRRERPGSSMAGRAAYYMAVLAVADGQPELAAVLSQETVSAAPHTEEAAGAWLLMADLRVEQTSLSAARVWLNDHYSTASLTRRQQATLAKRLGDYARAEHAYAEAIQWYTHAQQVAPSLAGETTYRMASCYEEAGDVEAALRYYQAVQQTPWVVRGRLAAAKLLERQGRMQEAETIYAALAQQGIPESKVVQERLAALQAHKASAIQAR